MFKPLNVMEAAKPHEMVLYILMLLLKIFPYPTLENIILIC